MLVVTLLTTVRPLVLEQSRKTLGIFVLFQPGGISGNWWVYVGRRNLHAHISALEHQ
jgi:hypothetical protein